MDVVIVESDASRANGWFKALWVLLAAKGGALRSLPFDSPSSRLRPLPEKRILWRDDYSKLFQILE